MVKNNIFAIGVMSGTSLDGIDLVYVHFNEDKYADFKIIHAETIAYSKEWKQLLQNAIFSDETELQKLDRTYGKYLGNIINHFISNYKILKVDFIASHGHTILHQPEKGITLQIGAGNEIAKITKQKVVCDFRTQDVKLGGQGAPLVPIGDELLFSEYDFCLNLGGFSNISYHTEGVRIAFDICPVNIVLNFYVQKLNLEFDASGKIASEGKINTALLETLNLVAFYQKVPPKSLGLEWVQKEIFPLIDRLETDIPSILRTFVEHIAMQIGGVIYKNNAVLSTGGGVFNTFLMNRIEYHAKNSMKLPTQELIDFKEALVFAFLGYLKIKHQVNCLKSVTGARKNHSSGVIFYP
ncbi:MULTISPECIES: anhydro-N-acetylmuramic acid kinase [unclassified Polaribacter]|uniref:anhydro-N-acetylmuramic acid kinase n=1 Tax=unclassified Polaribacter TaxID=196858 RepID=UPI0011BD4E1B|nr:MULTISPECIES: anhydro-N-acetylmuramic acid kinase [unclassified Polaribacter]TXD51419.1 anhydro-N-acetylmuramic acid kinase [Polaribacter sp. IC063]TXD57253.1 anhydro-N-acetylmuramic acid kinase [Polaribacter sp. IC066]